MQTPLGVFLRGLLMLVCVTSILLAALCGPLLPGALSSVLPGRINCANNKASQEGAENFFEPLSPPGMPSTRPADPMLPGSYHYDPARDSTWPNQQPKLGDHWAGSARTDGGRNSILGAGSVPWERQWFSIPTLANDAGNNPCGPNWLQQASASLPRVNEAAVSQTPTLDDIHARLQRLGVTYYTLELQEPHRPLYRFYCRLSGADEPGSFGQFEAADRDPFRAMWRVLMEVERYYYGRQVAGAPAEAQ